ncbi:MAG: hypothetical protein V7707_08970 [Motiliproteus sp.]
MRLNKERVGVTMISRRKKIVIIVLLLLGSSSAWSGPLNCHVDGSDDQFILYLDQRIYRSEQFDVYALMGGMTLATVSRASLRFNRLTQLNLLKQPDRIQWFEGQCVEATEPYVVPSAEQ